MTGCGQDTIGPQFDLSIACRLSEADALFDQSAADPVAAGGGLHQKQAQLRDARILFHEKHTANACTVEFSDPTAVPFGPSILRIFGHDACDKRLKLDIPSILLRVEASMATNDPPKIAGLQVTEPDLTAGFSLRRKQSAKS